MIRSTQKIIKIGTSEGVTLPSKLLKEQNLKAGDEVEVTIRTTKYDKNVDEEVVKAAKSILETYKKDFDNLSQR